MYSCNIVNSLLYENEVSVLLWSEPGRRPRLIRERVEHFDEYHDVDFRRRFRMSKATALSVLKLIEEQLEFPSDKNECVSPINQLLATLRFYATNCDLTSLADYGGFSKSSAQVIVHRVTTALASLRPHFIYFPNTQEYLQKLQKDFYHVAKFPSVVGAIDCTHVRIQSPGGCDAEVFRNRKNYFSINVQAVCDPKMKFSNIVTRWQGSADDSYIFKNSLLCGEFKNKKYGDSLLLADAGYPCTSYMMTPIDGPKTPVEHLYNESHIRTRDIIERTFGVWKRRFPVLALGIRTSLANARRVIIATAVLHNIIQDAGETLPMDDVDLDLPAPWDQLLMQGEMGIQVNAHDTLHRRNSIVQDYFGTLIQI